MYADSGYAGRKISACCLVMAAVWNRAGRYIFMLWFPSSIYLLSFFLA